MDPEVAFHDERPSLAQGLVGAQFTIEHVAGEWLRIADIDPVTDALDPAGAEAPRANYQGSGWVHESRVRINPVSTIGRVEPSEQAPSTAEPAGGNSYSAQTRVIDCRGRWAQVEYVRAGPAGRSLSRAWIMSQSTKQHADALRRALSAEGDRR